MEQKSNIQPNKGDFYQFQNWVGYVDFTSHNYVTLCISEKEDKETLIGYRQVKLLVFREEWEQLKPVNKKEYAEQFPHSKKL